MKIDFYLKNLQLETINKHIFRFYEKSRIKSLKQ